MSSAATLAAGAPSDTFAPATSARAAFAPAAANARALIVPPSGGTPVSAFGSTIVFKLASADTGDTFVLALGTTPPGEGPPVHRHLTEDELFIIASGEEEVFVDGRWTPVEPGTVVYLPRGVAHTFRNAGTTPSSHWVLTMPGGFDRFYAACGELFAAAAAAGTAPDVARLATIFAAHNYTIEQAD
jgi:mannose-6-phosphate isomerase-like protein (cupin superfamily)